MGFFDDLGDIGATTDTSPITSTPGPNFYNDVNVNLKPPTLTPFESFGTGLGTAAENTVLGLMQSVTPKDSTWGKKLDAYGKQLNKEYEESKAVNPLSTMAGYGTTGLAEGAAIGLAAAPIGAGLKAIPAISKLPELAQAGANLAGQGAAVGASQFVPSEDENGRLRNAVVGAVATPLLGAGISLGLKGLGATFDATKNVGTAIYNGLKNSLNWADNATAKTLDKVSGDFANAAPKDFYDSIINTKNEFKEHATDLYNNRNDIARQSGQTVPRTEMQQYLNDIKEKSATGITPEDKEILKTGKDFLGNGKPISYEQAQDALSDIGKVAYSKRLSDPLLANKYKELHTALDNDINNAVTYAGNTDLQKAHTLASTFYNESYAPLRSFVNKNADLTGALDKFSTESFLSNVSKSLINPKTGAGMRETFNDVLSPEQRQMFYAAHVNSLKEASVDNSGEFNIGKYLTKLSSDVKKSGGIYGDKAADMETLAQAIGAKAAAEKSIPSSGTTFAAGLLGSAGGFIAGGPGAAIGAGIASVPKAAALYSAGKMLNNPQVAALLDTARSVGDNAEIRNVLNDKIGKAYTMYTNQYASAIPNSLSKTFSSPGLTSIAPNTPDTDPITGQPITKNNVNKTIVPPITATGDTKGLRNMNPGNLRPSKVVFNGQTGVDAGGFAQFKSHEDGIAAIGKTIDTYASTGRDTPTTFVQGNGKKGGWSQTDQKAYINNISNALGIKPTDKMDVKNPEVKAKLIGAITQMENGKNPYTKDQIYYSLGVFGNPRPVTEHEYDSDQKALTTPINNIMGGDKISNELSKTPAFEAATNAHNDLIKQGVTKSPIYTVVDYSKPASEKRLWVVNGETGKVLMNTYVAHGSGSGGIVPDKFSNQSDSHMSSTGRFVTDVTYNGKHGLSLRIRGLDKGVNDAVYDRSVVVHGADYIGDGKVGRSWGCLAVPNKDTAKLINLIKGQTVIYSYGKNGPQPTQSSLEPIYEDEGEKVTGSSGLRNSENMPQPTTLENKDKMPTASPYLNERLKTSQNRGVV